MTSDEEALSLIDKLIAKSEAEEVFVSLQQSESLLSRFVANQISQNISRQRLILTITSYFGKQSASATTTDMETESLTATLHRSEELARLAPEDPEWTPLVEPQTYEPRLPAFDKRTAILSPLARGKTVKRVCAMSNKLGVEGSGTLSTENTFQAIGNSRGVRTSDRSTEADFTFTAKEGDGSSWSRKTAFAFDSLAIEETTEEVIKRALASRSPRPIKPGTYPVIFHGTAFASLLPWLTWNMTARAAEEGRSFMSRTDDTGVATRVGEQLFSPLVQIQRHPSHSLLRAETFFGDGLPNNYLEIVKDGVPQILAYSRYWAQKQGKEPTGPLFPLVMRGSEQSLEQLIASTERGIFVTRAWYVRYVNPRTLEVTGMTRDGTFWIEEGKLAYPVQNLRFNQKLPEMFKGIDAVSKVNRCGDNVVPGVRVKAFHFSSVTDSI